VPLASPPAPDVRRPHHHAPGDLERLGGHLECSNYRAASLHGKVKQQRGLLTIFLKTGGFPLGTFEGSREAHLHAVRVLSIAAKRDRP
jgi:hypothetical protein